MTPYFQSFAEFIAMGKHGFYVWTCYGLTCIAIIGLIFYSRSQRHNIYKDTLTQQARQTQRRNRIHTDTSANPNR